MKKFCLIGLGTITKRYLKGIFESGICLLAVSDIDENAVSREYYSKYPFYSDYKEMISREHPDGVIISTPPKTHFEIASYCLENNVNVIIEKPVPFV
ncbi:MAG: Gfo/Idh/MocA family oxidoreductase [Clostridia bacterium]|nr:Gfo/Idh/MocA family oxidoreductase [Clostridia bacterium]